MKRIAFDTVSMIAYDMVQFAEHFKNPCVKHNMDCLLCGRAVHQNAFNALSSVSSVLPQPASTDLNLLSTKSDYIRQISILGGDKTNASFLRFVRDLTLHAGYSETVWSLEFSIPKFHVLTCFLTSVPNRDKQVLKLWLRTMLAQTIARFVIVAPMTETCFLNETFADEDMAGQKITFVYYETFAHVVNILQHTSLMTKHRLTPNDVLKFANNKITILGNCKKDQCLFF